MDMVNTSPIRISKKEKRWLQREAIRRDESMTFIIRELIQDKMKVKK